MKHLNDGTQVPDRVWYYILDWKDRNHLRFCQFLGHDHLIKVDCQSLTNKQISDLFKMIALEDCNLMAGTESTNYITHKQIDKITPVYEDGKQAGLCITLRNGQLYWTSESFSTDQHGITGKFTGKINSKSIGTGFPPGSPNDDAARLAAHG